MDRRTFIQTAAAAAVVAGIGAEVAEATPNKKAEPKKEEKDSMKKIIVAADPFAITLKDAVVADLKDKGYEVVDVGAKVDKDQEKPYFESAVEACKLIQAEPGTRGVLFCGTGMGMNIIANRFKGITASVVESVFAAKMCRAINNSNVLCLGAMIWGDWMAKEAVQTFLNTKFTEGLEPLADFLNDAYKKVSAIRD